MLNKVKEKIKEIIWKIKYSLYKLKCKIKKQEEYILFGTPLHGNLGDQAIAIAEYEFLKDCGIKDVFEIPGFDRKYIINYLEAKIPKGGILLAHGGGYIGSLWINEEEMIREFIEKFPNNKIVIFPQTIFYEETEEGKEELKKSLEIYNNHNDLTICVREKYSYEFSIKEFTKIKTLLVPDIVLYIKNLKIPVKQRKGVLLCMRRDKEKKITNIEEDKIYSCISKYDEIIDKTDTVLDNANIKPRKRKKLVMDKLKEFKKYKLVITDRLHGMIFSAITGTPCIAIGNCNYKVKGVYDWIKDLDYISYIDDLGNFELEINRLMNIKECEYIFDRNKNYEELRNILWRNNQE